MADDLYKNLGQQLDHYGLGYPPTETGVEIKILKKLFTEPEAQMVLDMSVQPETAEAIAERIGQPPEKVAGFLDKMATKGLLFRSHEGGTTTYSVAPFMIGLFENMPKSIDEELAQLCEQYFTEGFFVHFRDLPVTFARVIPVDQAVETKSKIHSFEEARDYILTKDRIAIHNCICRTQKEKLGQACNSPRETCMSFDWYADYLVDIKLGRYIDEKEALEIQEQCEKAGLITFTPNLEDSPVFCHCCPCCCITLRSVATSSRPADYILSNYYAEVDQESCTGCGACESACQMQAIAVNASGVALVNRDRCIGCGGCVANCEVQSIRLVSKPDAERASEPSNLMQMTLEMTEKRKKTLVPLFRK